MGAGIDGVDTVGTVGVAELGVGGVMLGVGVGGDARTRKDRVAVDDAP